MITKSKSGNISFFGVGKNNFHFRFHLYFFYPSHCRLCKSVKKKFARWSDDPKYKDVHFAMGNVTEIEGEFSPTEHSSEIKP